MSGPCRVLASVAVAILTMYALFGLTPVVAQPAIAAMTEEQAAYRVGPGDVLKIVVYRAPTFDSVVQIAPNGSIPINQLGPVDVNGLTPPQVGQKIASSLREKQILIDPVVNVLVQEYHSRTVVVIGKVSKSGEYSLDRADLRLRDILGRAGADLGLGGGTIRVTSASGVQEEFAAEKVLTGEVDRVVQPRDVIAVIEAKTFFIAGEVRNPGVYPIVPGLTMDRAIAIAGGLSPRGSKSSLKVKRLPNGENGQISAAAESIKVKAEDAVQPSDLITVGSRIF